MLSEDRSFPPATQILDLKGPDSKRITTVMPPPSPTALALQAMEPEALIDNMPVEVAEQIVAEWRVGREDPNLPRAQASSIRQYRNNAGILENRYSIERNVEPGLLNPIDFVKSLLYHAKSLSPSAWKLYRHSLLYTMNERAKMMQEKGMPHSSLIITLATLVVVTRHPYLGKGKTGPKPGSVQRQRAKTLPAKYFDALVTYLATNVSTRNKIARLAQSFLISTMATGIRPTEWKTAVLRSAETDEIPTGHSPAGWVAITVKTAKRKDTEEESYRTILIEPGLYQIHIRQHLDSLAEILAKNERQEDPDRDYIRRVSTTIKRASRTLWPTRPDRHCTLYTLRSQARANIAAVHGKYVAAGMLGHSPETGASYYAGHTKSNLPRKGALRSGFANIPIPYPGKDALAKASEFQQRDVLRGQAANADQMSVLDGIDEDEDY